MVARLSERPYSTFPSGTPIGMMLSFCVFVFAVRSLFADDIKGFHMIDQSGCD